MKSINKDEALIDFLSQDWSLTSSKLTKIDIFERYGLVSIDLYFDLLSNNKIKLTFIDVKEFSFYHSSKYVFYNVEILKLFKDGQGFYLSLDPFDEKASISEKDNDFILAASIEGFAIED